MDPNATRPIITGKVLYRCTCGNEVQLDPEQGGSCPKCRKQISAKVLAHELAMTMTILDGSFELVQPAGGDEPATNAGIANLTQPKVGTTQTNPDRSPSRESIDEDDPGILIGEKFGHFEIVSPLGRGGMGQVYRALDTSLQRYVAVKLLRSGIGGSKRLSKSSEQEVDKLLQEAVSQARVAHPNIVTIYYVGKQDGSPFLAMELVNGKPLSARIAEKNIPFSEIASIAVQICEALKFSYELDLIHGDIKPSNMLLQSSGIAKLSDFGMARRASSDDDNSIGGTPNYIAPELLQGEKPSLQSDIYALGVTLYEMAFGELPVDLTGKTIPEWIKVHDASFLTFPTPWPDRLPEASSAMLEKMLAKNPADRYDSYDALILDLKHLTPASQVVARPFPRIVAAGIDWISVLLLAILLQIAFSINALSQWVTTMLQIADFVPILIYTAVVYFWRQSLGRSLMHIRVVNKYGLRPKRLRMALRSMLRMQFPWFAILLSLFDDPTRSWFGIATLILVIVSGATLLLDVAFMVIYDKRRSLHDQIFGTQVVIDMEN